MLIVNRLVQHVEELHGFTDGLTDAQLKQRPAPEKWSLHELAMHLCETQDVFIERVARILVEDKPAIELYEPDKARQEGLYFTENLKQRISEFEMQRETFVSLLQTLSDKQWKQEGVHPEVNHYTVEKCTEALMRHEEHHLYQMYTVFFGAHE